MNEPYNIESGCLLQDRKDKTISAVSAICIDKYNGVEVRVNKMHYKGKNKDIKLCIDDTYCSYYSTEELYKKFELVGINYQLFKKD